MGFREGDRKGWKKYVPRTNKKKVENSESSNDAIKTSVGTVEDTEHSGRRWRLRSAVMKPFRRGRKSKSKQGNQEEGQNFDKNETVEKNSESQHLPRVDVRSVSPSTDTAAERPVASQQDEKALNDADKPGGSDAIEHVGNSGEDTNSKAGSAWGYMSSRSIQHVDVHASHIINRLRESDCYKEDHLVRRFSAPSPKSPDTDTRLSHSSNSPESPPLRRMSLVTGVSPIRSPRSRCRRSSNSLKGQPGAINRTDIIHPLTMFSPKGLPVPYAPHFGGVASSGFELFGGYFAQEPPGNGYGSYTLMRKVDNKAIYTVKVFNRYSMEEEDLETQRKAAESIVTERRILESHNNPYIMSTCASFQDGKNLYLVLDFEGGESLALCINRLGRFSEAASLLLVAELVDATFHLHGMGIAHRLISCDAVLIDKWGHVCLTDLGHAKFGSAPIHGSITACGQDPYMSPEMVFDKKGSGLASDWWSVGVVTSMLLAGKLPLLTVWVHDIEIQVEDNLSTISSFISEHAVDFMRQLMKVKPGERMVGSHVVEHRFLSSIDSELLAKKGLIPQYRPLISTKII